MKRKSQIFYLGKVNLNIFLFILILILGSIVRISRLQSIPAGFFCDEASIGFNAYNLLVSGTDEHGVSFPVFFEAFGEYKNPVQIYSTIPFIFSFGLNEFSTRLTSATYGILSLISIYLLVKELFKHHKQTDNLAFLSMFFLAISPWHIHLSRIAFETMPYVFFTTSALYLFLKAQRTPKLLPVATVFFALALYSYFPARMFIPLFGVGLFFIYFRFFISHKKETILSLFLLILLLLPLIQNSLSPAGFIRWQQVNIFSHQPKNETVLQHIALNYFRHFSIDFLFLKGDIDMPGQFITRHSVRGIGELYFFQLPLVILGFFSLLKRKNKAFLVLLIWLVLYPIGSMFTTNSGPQATRSIIGVVPFQIFSAVGILYLLQIILNIKTKKPFYFTSIILVIVIVSSIINYLTLYFTSYTKHSSDFWGWQYGAKSIVNFFTVHETVYDDLIMAPAFNAPEIFFKFYAPNKCRKCKIGLPENFYARERKQLFAITPLYAANHPSFRFKIIKTIYYPDGNAAFILVEI